MEIGFETIGNATFIAYEDGNPILSTDPWINGSPYFGSWKLSYEIPNQQQNSIENSEFIWISHAHPDHLDLDTINNFKKKKISTFQSLWR